MSLVLPPLFILEYYIRSAGTRCPYAIQHPRFARTLLITVQLLHKLSIRGVNGSEKLLRVIKVSLSTLFAVSWDELIVRTQSLIISPRIPLNSVCQLNHTARPLTHLFISFSAYWSSAHLGLLRGLDHPADIQPYPLTHLLSDYPSSSPHYPKHILLLYSSELWQGGESLSLLIFFPQPLSFLHPTFPLSLPFDTSPARPAALAVALANNQCGQFRRSIR